jgi:REP element-mobilizing transposase RayT
MSSSPRRKSPRLQGFDYRTCGLYFVTICSYQQRHIFGSVVGTRVILSSLGSIVHQQLEELSQHQPMVTVHSFIVMPNHIHALIEVISEQTPVANRSLSTIVGTFKYMCAKQWRKCTGNAEPIWQRSFHDRYVRDERQYMCYLQYILDNPIKWSVDELNSKARGGRGDAPPLQPDSRSVSL